MCTFPLRPSQGATQKGTVMESYFAYVPFSAEDDQRLMDDFLKDNPSDPAPVSEPADPPKDTAVRSAFDLLAEARELLMAARQMPKPPEEPATSIEARLQRIEQMLGLTEGGQSNA